MSHSGSRALPAYDSDGGFIYLSMLSRKSSRHGCYRYYVQVGAFVYGVSIARLAGGRLVARRSTDSLPHRTNGYTPLGDGSRV